MTRILDAYLYRQLVGHLTQDGRGEMGFQYVQAWLDNPEAIPLSYSLPLRVEAYGRSECRGFFAGLLPEQENRARIAKNLGISAKNDFSMLEEIGGECAGAVTFVPAGQSLQICADDYQKLTNQELADKIRMLPRRPLLAGEKGIRLSLAGAQDKLAVCVLGENIALPNGDAPSSHILKPAIEQFEGTVFNEAFCMKLAASIGLPVPTVTLQSVEGLDYLLVERYDRLAKDGDPSGCEQLERVHQEDFCQALGVWPENKYQREGGPSLKQCFDLVRTVSSISALNLRSLLDVVIFNFLIGNNDAHGKNFSLLYVGKNRSSMQTKLAPSYDLVSTVYYADLDQKMAMKIGSEYVANKVMSRHFEQFAEEAGLNKALVLRRIRALARVAISKAPEVKIAHRIADDIAKLVCQRCERVLRLFSDQK